MKNKRFITRHEVCRTIAAVDVFSDSLELSVDLFRLGRVLESEGDYAAGYTCKECAVSLQGAYATMERMREVIRILLRATEAREGRHGVIRGA